MYTRNVIFNSNKKFNLQLDRDFLYMVKYLLYSIMSTSNFIYDITPHY